MGKMPHIFFVCLGNICRSPTAEAVFRKKAAKAGFDCFIDSAGTGGWHQGDPPDPRSIEHGEARGYDFSGQSSRKVTRDDFTRFDYILAMDHDNLSHLKRMTPRDYPGHVSLFLDFHPEMFGQPVPDPYYGGARGFDHVVELIERASDGLLEHLKAR